MDELQRSESKEDSEKEDTIVCFMAIEKNNDEGNGIEVNDKNPS